MLSASSRGTRTSCWSLSRGRGDGTNGEIRRFAACEDAVGYGDVGSVASMEALVDVPWSFAGRGGGVISAAEVLSPSSVV